MGEFLDARDNVIFDGLCFLQVVRRKDQVHGGMMYVFLGKSN
jgi:hypothetical protein